MVVESNSLNSEHMNPLIVDLNNFILEDKDLDNRGKVKNIEKLVSNLKKSGYNEIILIASSKLKYRIDNKKEYKKMVKKYDIKESPAMVDTDWFILDLAKKLDCDILTNDRFKEYWDEFGRKWIMNIRRTFMIVNELISIKL